MYKICVFAGTTEGRKLVEFLMSQPALVTACVATEYGKTLIKPADNLTVLAKRLTEEEMEELFLKTRFDLVIDATHPYASEVTENIEAASNAAGIEYMRLLRGKSIVTADTECFSDISEAVEYLNKTEGNILLTTGSKELLKYTKIKNFKERVYARVLPTVSSIEACSLAGLTPSHIMAMQGPFTEEMNVSLISFADAKYMITKDGGISGGFEEKNMAAQKTGVKLVVIGRPAEEEGLSFSEVTKVLCERFGFSCKPNVTIVGIGPGNKDAMTEEVKKAISDADCIIGAERMITAVGTSGQNTYIAIAPDKTADFIASHPEHSSFTVVMSGDVGFFSGAKKLLPRLVGCEVKVLPGVSSLSYFCGRLKMSYEDITVVSLHGRDYNIVADIRKKRRVFVLVGGECGINNLCRTLTDKGLGYVKMYVGERLSYEDEKITKGRAEELISGNYDALSVAVIENEHACNVVTHGLSDNEFLRKTGETENVPMTKSEVRSVCLSKLRLREDSVCWDIGAGTGSVAVEMALMALRGSVYAIEKNPSALRLIEQNKEEFSLNNLTVLCGEAPDCFEKLPSPTHAFIGGSSGNMKEIIEKLLNKNAYVRIVATAISLETVAVLNECIKEFGFAETEIVSLNVSRAKSVGSHNLMMGQNPVYIFTMQNGGKNK